MEFLFRFPQDVGKVLHVDHAFLAVQDLYEPAHVRALVIVGKVHVHVDRGYGVLKAIRLVENGDGIGDVLYTHLVYLNMTAVMTALYIFHPWLSP
jgi:hypothetical protein